MTKCFASAVALAAVSLVVPSFAAAQSPHDRSTAPVTLTDGDRAEIQKLTSGYAEFIGTCKPEAYAGLFESPHGYFESLARGRVWGRDALIGVVRSEPSCAPDAKNLRARDTPPAVISVTERGVVGRIDSRGEWPLRRPLCEDEGRLAVQVEELRPEEGRRREVDGAGLR